MTEAPIWPDRLRIRDTGLHDDLGGPGQRIYTTAGRGYERQEYVHVAQFDALAAERDALRAALEGAFAEGLVIRGFDPAGGGRYLLAP